MFCCTAAHIFTRINFLCRASVDSDLRYFLYFTCILQEKIQWVLLCRASVDSDLRYFLYFTCILQENIQWVLLCRAS
jgi:hypothetical protein